MREFAISAGGITLVGSTPGLNTLVFVNPGTAATTPNLEFLRFWASQSGSTTSAQQRVQIVTQVTAFPTLTSATPAKLKFYDAVSVITGGTAGAAGTAGTNASAEGAGAKTVAMEDAFNVITGWLHVPTPPESRIMPAGSASGQGMYFPAAPGSVTNWAFGLIFREI